jgi:hypothetical protein
MLIKIEGLPEGQKIEHINVDIKFVDGVATAKTTTKVETEPKDIPLTSNLTASTTPEGPNIRSSSESKPIPPEMSDMEF